MKRFRLMNNIFGWVAFAIAALTYLLTMEPTASFWDCPEVISAAFKLDVGHPPGAPFSMLVGHFFSLFAKDVSHAAMMINSISALCSAFSVLFLFWTITHLARKVVIKSEDDYTTANIIGILGAGLVGALAFTFSDTFWFSAVEGTVFGFSALFTSMVFWLILKWERVSDRPGSDRWLIIIAYLMGLSVGVHLLNLLTIPVLVLVFYFKKNTPTAKGIILSLIGGAVLLAAVLYGLIPGFLEVSGWFELLFVNVFGLGFNSGVIVYVVLTLGLLSWGIYESYKDENYVRMAISCILAIVVEGLPFFSGSIILGIVIIAALVAYFYYQRVKIKARWINTGLIMISMFLIGFSSYSVIVIRANAKPAMNQNEPNNVFALKYYLNREQYGQTPLLYGKTFNSPVKLKVEGNMCSPEQTKGEPTYSPKPKTSASDKDEYIITGYKTDYVMDERFNMLFPRMYDDKPQSIEAYKQWGKITGETVNYDYCGQQKSAIKPTFTENMRFFFDYQINFMYWRYFMWNFSGRQNDLQGYGEIDHGNWITGIGFIDNLLVGDQQNLPSELKDNKGHNVYYMLPLLLGIFGMLFMIYGGKKGVEGFWLVTLLFLFTGIAIVIYLNQTPYQPRERDYAYAGSFYAFCIWIGFGVLAIVKAIDKYLPKIPRTASAAVVTLCCLGVPALMAQQNWDDHDRSNRYTCRDFGQNYLASIKPNAIIFTNGDNDTFPLWYNQEVEGIGTDVRVCNLSYLQTDWYIGQMQRASYKSAPLPISWQPKDYFAGKNEILDVEDILQKPLDIKTAFDFILSTDPTTKMRDGGAFIPTKQLYIPIDAQQVISTGTLPVSRAAEIIPQINIDLKGRLTKSEIMILEMLKENHWKRPVYFAVTVGADYYLGLEDHFELTGLAYQILPVGVKGGGSQVNTDEMYNNLMYKFKYGNIADPKVYLDENITRMCDTHRMMFCQLIQALMAKGDTVKARKALEYCNKVIPGTTVRHDYISTQLADFYYKLREPAKGNAIMDAVAKDCVENLDWYLSLDGDKRSSVNNRIGHNMAVLNQVLRICEADKQKMIMDKYLPHYIGYTKRVQM